MTYLIGCILALIIWTIHATLKILNNPSKYDSEDLVVKFGMLGILFVVCSWASVILTIVALVTLHIHKKMKEVKDEQQ